MPIRHLLVVGDESGYQFPYFCKVVLLTFVVRLSDSTCILQQQSRESEARFLPDLPCAVLHIVTKESHYHIPFVTRIFNVLG